MVDTEEVMLFTSFVINHFVCCLQVNPLHNYLKYLFFLLPYNTRIVSKDIMMKAGRSYIEEALPISSCEKLIVVMHNVENIMRNYSFTFIDIKFVLDTLMDFRINFPETYHPNRCISS